MNDREADNELVAHLRTILLKLAKQQDDLGAHEAAATPSWAPCPPSVIGRRAAAAVLRVEADQAIA